MRLRSTLIYLMLASSLACSANLSSENSNRVDQNTPAPDKGKKTSDDVAKATRKSTNTRNGALKAFLAKKYPGWAIVGQSANLLDVHGFQTDADDDFGNTIGLNTEFVTDLHISKGTDDQIVSIQFRLFETEDSKLYWLATELAPLRMEMDRLFESLKETSREAGAEEEREKR